MTNVHLYRRKPVEFEAWQIGSYIEKGIPQPQWLTNAIGEGRVEVNGAGYVIHTLEGAHTADPKDWIVRGIKGEMWPVKPEIFDATYEKV